MKVCYGILNFNRKISHSLINKIPSLKDIVICTNDIDKIENNKNRYNVIRCVESCAASKNLILKYAKDNKYDYCFIIEDDIQIVDTSIFNMYVNMSKNFNTDLVFYGFNNNKSRVANGKLNPIMSVSIDDGRSILVHRNACGGFSCFRIHDYMMFYDESLHLFETEYLCYDMRQSGFIPYNGFFFDIFDSNKYLSRLDVKTERVKIPSMARDDISRRGEIEFDYDTNHFCNYVIDRCVQNKLNIDKAQG